MLTPNQDVPSDLNPGSAEKPGPVPPSSPDALSDEDLAVRVAETDDDRTWQILFERSQVYLLQYAYSLGRGKDEADDLVQDTLLRAWTHRANYDPAYPYRGWLRMILRRLATTEHRRDRAFTSAVEKAQGRGLDELWHSERPMDVSDQVGLSEHRGRILRILQQMSEEEQSLLMTWAEGASGRDLADALEILPSTARGRLKRAKDRLSALYATTYEEDLG